MIGRGGGGTEPMCTYNRERASSVTGSNTRAGRRGTLRRKDPAYPFAGRRCRRQGKAGSIFPASAICARRHCVGNVRLPDDPTHRGGSGRFPT